MEDKQALERAAASDVRIVLLGLRKGWTAPAFVGSYLALVTSESLRIISALWRRDVNIAEVERIVARDHHEIVADWEHTYAYFRRLITDPDGLNDDEMLIVMGQRSTLELLGAFLGGSYLERAAALDEAFTESLRYNAVVVGPNRARRTLGLEARLPTHWWWRQDTPG